MKPHDRDLGMGRKITRRDFVNGVSAGAAGATLLPQWAAAQEFAPEQSPDYYPPGAAPECEGIIPDRLKWRINCATAARWILSAVAHTNETYDLVIVGGGISGLGAAYYFLKERGRDARVLILDNHDDFGGHAKRNEFRHNGRLLAINGGTLNIEAPQRYNEAAKELLIEHRNRSRPVPVGERHQSQSLPLARIGPRTFFRQRDLGRGSLGGARSRPTRAWISRRIFRQRFLAKTPLSEQAQKDMLRLYDQQQPDYLPGMSSAEKKVRLAKMSYQDFSAQRRQSGPPGAVVLPPFRRRRILRGRRCDARAVRVADGPAGISRACSSTPRPRAC